MANLLQSSQNQATTAPGFYTDYLSNIASKGAEAQSQAQYVGAQPLQTKAFETAEQNLAAQQPTFEQGKTLLGQAANQNITGATAPYLQAATSASPLSAAQPLICESANLNLGALAGDYMSPYINKAVQSLSDIGQRNIRQNLSPMATAAAVGSGQFGSTRGAQVLGQIKEQAEQDLNSQMAQMLNTGYGQALTAAQAKQGALSQLAGTTASAQQAQNAAQLQAASTAGCAAAKQASAAQQAGAGLGTLAQQASGVNLACINALATLGGQQQTIGQNAQNFPLTSLASLASLLSGYTMPTSTKTTLCMSPLSAVGAVGSGIMGLLQCTTPGSGKSVLSGALGNLKGLFGSSGGAGAGAGSAPTYVRDANGNYVPSDSSYGELVPPGDSGYYDNNIPDYMGGSGLDTSGGGYDYCCCYRADGGRIESRAIGGGIGCGSAMGVGAAPAGLCFAACLTCTPFNPQGGVADGIAVGCASTQNLGALPNMG